MQKLRIIVIITLLVIANCNSPKNSKEKKPKVDSNLSQGQRYYHLRGCVKCHGIKGDGKGVRTTFLKINPRNFSDKSSFKQGYRLKEISQTLKNGIKNEPKSLMPKYPFITDEERNQIALYVLYLSTNQ